MFCCCFFFLGLIDLLYFFLFDAGLELNSIHKSDNLLATVKEAQGFFVGGGNTFLLLKTLYELNLLEAIKSRVLQVHSVITLSHQRFSETKLLKF